MDITRFDLHVPWHPPIWSGSPQLNTLTLKNAQSNHISTHRHIAPSTGAGKAREIIAIEPATRRRLVSWRIHSHRLPSRRPCTPGRFSRSPSPITCIFTLCGSDTQLADTLGRLLAASRHLVGGRPFHLLSAQVRDFQVPVEL